jgi:hypothetical protein
LDFVLFCLESTTCFSLKPKNGVTGYFNALAVPHSSPLLVRSTDFSLLFHHPGKLKKEHTLLCVELQSPQRWISMRCWSRLGKEHLAPRCW